MSYQFVIDEGRTKEFEVALQKEAREEMKLKLLRDIRTDLPICEISELNPLEYTTELKEMIDSIYQNFKK